MLTLAPELVLSPVERVLGSTSVLVLVAEEEEEVLEAELRPVLKEVLLDLSVSVVSTGVLLGFVEASTVELKLSSEAALELVISSDVVLSAWI